MCDHTHMTIDQLVGDFRPKMTITKFDVRLIRSDLYRGVYSLQSLLLLRDPITVINSHRKLYRCDSLSSTKRANTPYDTMTCFAINGYSPLSSLYLTEDCLFGKIAYYESDEKFQAFYDSHPKTNRRRALLNAVYAGNIDRVRKLLSPGIGFFHLSLSISFFHFSLGIAARNDNLEIAKILVQYAREHHKTISYWPLVCPETARKRTPIDEKEGYCPNSVGRWILQEISHRPFGFRLRRENEAGTYKDDKFRLSSSMMRCH